VDELNYDVQYNPNTSSLREIQEHIPKYQRRYNLLTKIRDRFLERYPLPRTKYSKFDKKYNYGNIAIFQKKYGTPPPYLYAVINKSCWGCGCGSHTRVYQIYAERNKADNFEKKLNQCLEFGRFEEGGDSFQTQIKIFEYDPETRSYTT
jgi:hypothetical protein